MPIDPSQPLPTTPEARVAERLGALERELAELRRGGAPVSVGTGAPATDPNTLREGTRYIDRSGLRLYFTVGAPPASAWRYVALT